MVMLEGCKEGVDGSNIRGGGTFAGHVVRRPFPVVSEAREKPIWLEYVCVAGGACDEGIFVIEGKNQCQMFEY